MNSTTLPCFQFGMNCQGFTAARLTWPAYVDGRKLEIAMSENIALLLHRHVAKAHEIGTSSTKKRLLLVISTRFS